MSNQIKQVEVTIEQAKEVIALRDALDRLIKKKEFKQIIDIGYFQDEAARLVIARANPGLQGEAQQRALNNQITAVGEFRQYLAGIYQMGNEAEQSLAAHQEVLAELYAEDGDEDEDVSGIEE
jgi:hypothetical protein